MQNSSFSKTFRLLDRQQCSIDRTARSLTCRFKKSVRTRELLEQQQNHPMTARYIYQPVMARYTPTPYSNDPQSHNIRQIARSVRSSELFDHHLVDLKKVFDRAAKCSGSVFRGQVTARLSLTAPGNTRRVLS